MFNENTWHDGEKLAQEYLKKRGYKILGTNIKLGHWEADIVAMLPARKIKADLKAQLKAGAITKQGYTWAKQGAEDTLVIVEVKARATAKYGNPEEAVDFKKQQHLRKFAECYIKGKKLTCPVRFDVIAIFFAPAGADDKENKTNPEIRHIENAF